MAVESNPAAEFIRASENLSLDSFPLHSPERFAALQAARALVRRLETSIETAFEVSFTYPALLTALEVARTNDVFAILDFENHRPKTTKELTKTDEALMRRVLRHLAAVSIIEQTGPDMWAPTRHSTNFGKDEIFGAVRYGTLAGLNAHVSLVEYLAKTGYRDVTTSQGPFQAYEWNKTSMQFFDYVMSSPDLGSAFVNMMKGYNSQREFWTSVFDTSTLANTDGDGIVFVDIGGSVGHDAMKLVQRHPELRGRVVVQDRPDVIGPVKDALKTEGITGMAHDFFTEEPIKGAKAYYLHSILHDWPDEQGRQILQSVKPALKKGYSRLLINELILPETGADQYQTSLDLTMLAVLNSRERSEAEWRQFLKEEGFDVVKFWRGPGTPEGIVEAVLSN